MRRLLVLVLMLMILVGGDVATRLIAEERIEDRARSEVRGATSVQARITSFPFVPRLIVNAPVQAVDVRAGNVPARGVNLTEVSVELRGVEVDRDSILSRRLVLQDLERGTLTIELDGAALTNVAKVPVTVQAGEVRAVVAGRTLRVRPAVRGGSLVLQAAGVALPVPLARTGLLSCAAAGVTVQGARVRLSCEMDAIPPALGPAREAT